MMSFFKQLQWWKTFVTPDRYSYDQIPDQTGKVAIVTGANTGLGYATAVALAAHGAHVIFACRSKERALAAIDKAKKEIKETYPRTAPSEPKMEFLELDLNDMTKCKQSAEAFLDLGLPLHLLVNNSAVACPFELSADGIEKMFAVGHLGHFVFTMTLVDKLKESQPSRVVIVSSGAHEMTVPSGIDFENLSIDTKADLVTLYGRSKLANVLFSNALARRLSSERIFVNSCNPGVVRTELTRNENPAASSFQKLSLSLQLRLLGIPAKQGALNQLYLATSPEIENDEVTGRYFIRVGNEIQPSPLARDVALQERLWSYSEDMARTHVKVSTAKEDR